MEGRLGAAHVSAQAARALGVLSRCLTDKTIADSLVVRAIEDLVTLIEMANDGRIKVRLVVEDPTCDDFADFDDSEEPRL